MSVQTTHQTGQASQTWLSQLFGPRASSPIGAAGASAFSVPDAILGDSSSTASNPGVTTSGAYTFPPTALQTLLVHLQAAAHDGTAGQSFPTTSTANTASSVATTTAAPSSTAPTSTAPTSTAPTDPSSTAGLLSLTNLQAPSFPEIFDAATKLARAFGAYSANPIGSAVGAVTSLI